VVIRAGFSGFSLRHRARPLVLCASCGTRFDGGGATTGDRLRCPLCAEVVELDGVHTERRLYRSRAPLTFGGGQPEPRRKKKRPVVGSVPTPVALIALTLIAFFAFCVAFPHLSPVEALSHFPHW